MFVVCLSLALTLFYGIRPRSVPIVRPSSLVSLDQALRPLQMVFRSKLDKVRDVRVVYRNQDREFALSLLPFLERVLRADSNDSKINSIRLEENEGIPVLSLAEAKTDVLFVIRTLSDRLPECTDLLSCFERQTLRVATRKEFSSGRWVLALNQLGAREFAVVGRKPLTSSDKDVVRQ